MRAEKTLWPGLICWLGFWGNLFFSILLFVCIPQELAELKKPDPTLKTGLYILLYGAVVSAMAYWLVGSRYDFGRWIKLAANLPLTVFFLSIAVMARNIEWFTLTAFAPLAWPLFLLLFFKRKPE